MFKFILHAGERYNSLQVHAARVQIEGNGAITFTDDKEAIVAHFPIHGWSGYHREGEVDTGIYELIGRFGIENVRAALIEMGERAVEESRKKGPSLLNEACAAMPCPVTAH